MSAVLVIGAGVIGVTSALLLARDGHEVVLLDRKGVAAEASAGNAGALALTDIEPLASPGIMRKAPGWLFDPTGPLALHPGHAPRMAEWLWRFWRSSAPHRVEASAAAIADLQKLSSAAFDDLFSSTRGGHLVRRDGQLQLYEGKASFDAARPVWDRRAKHGVVFDLIEGTDGIAAIQPGLSPRFTHAGFTPEWRTLTDPRAWVQHLLDAFRDAGGKFEIGDVTSVRPLGERVRVVGDRDRDVDVVVVAAGAWSHRIAATLGERIPLDTERGYNTTISDPGVELKTFLTFSDHGFVISKTGGGIRVGGAVEFAGLQRPPNPKRWDALLAKARAFLPGLRTEGGTPWMGFRPSLPDSLPVIGASRRSPRIVYAFGHGHYGMTQSAGTGRLVADLVAGRATEIDLAPFRPDRFGWRS